MPPVTAALVKDLRARTGAGMMDAKKALEEAGGDLEAAVDALRTKGLATAGKKADRATGEGVVALALSADGRTGALAEVNCETDFVARNADFQAFAARAATTGLDAADAAALAAALEAERTEMIAKIGENLVLRRHARLSVAQGAVVGYTHAALAPNLGKIGVLVALESTAPAEKLAEAGKQIAMHVAAAAPAALDRDSVSPEDLERERAVLKAQAMESGKPADIAEKMVAGRLGKFYEAQCLVEQPLVMNPDVTVGAFVEAAGQGAGAAIAITGFARLALGEGA
jgi:elongation factor Ts